MQLCQLACDAHVLRSADDCLELVGGYQNTGAPLQRRREFFRACALVVQVIAHSWRVNLKVIQQLLGLASVLAGDAVYVAQDAQGSQGDVLKIADGSGYKIQARCKRLV